MKEKLSDRNLVSYCWLYCGACKKYLADKCPGCKNLKKTPFWCTIRDCCINKKYENCAECKEFEDVTQCKKYNGIIMRSLGYLCGSDRLAATKMIKEKGLEKFTEYMKENQLQRINRQKNA